MKFNNKNGTAIVEFAIVLPLLLVIVFGIVEFGTLLYNQQVITNASREGARAGIESRTPRLPIPSIDKVVKDYCWGPPKRLFTFGNVNSPPTINVTGHSDSALFGQDLKVQVTYNFEFLVIPNFIPGINRLRTMRAETLMKYEMEK